MKFSFRNKHVNGGHGGQYGYHDLFADELQIGGYQAWLFGSCGSGAFQSFNYGGYGDACFWNDAKKVEAFIVFLKKDGVRSVHGYDPKEFLFLITGTQKTTRCKALVAHPCVKEVDSFLNQAHGPEKLHLYRLSLLKAFG